MSSPSGATATSVPVSNQSKKLLERIEASRLVVFAPGLCPAVKGPIGVRP